MLDFLPLTLLHQDVSIEVHEREGQVHGVTTMHFCNESTGTGVDYAAFHYRGTTQRVQVAGCDLLEEMDETKWKWATADAALSVHTTAKSAEESMAAALKRGNPCDPVTLEGLQTWRASQYDVLALVPPSLSRLKKLVLRVHFCSRVARTAPGTVRFVGDGHVLLRSAPGQARTWLPCVDDLTTTPSWRVACGGGAGAERRQVLAGPPTNAAATASDLVVLLGVAEMEPALKRSAPSVVFDEYKGNQVLVVGVDSTASLPAHVKTVVSVCLENAIRLFELKDAPFVKLVFAEGVSANGIVTHVGCGVILLPLSLLQPCDDGDSSPWLAGACHALRVPSLFYELAKAVFMLFLGKSGKGCFFRPQSYADVWMVTGFAGGLAWHHMLGAFGIVNTCVWLERFAAATRAELSALKAEGLGDVVLSRGGGVGAEGSVYLCGLAERKSVLVLLQLCARLVRKTDAERLDASRWLPGISMLVKSLVNVHLGSAVSQELSELAADGRHGRGSRTPELRASYSTFYAPPFLSTKAMLDFLSVSQDVDLKSFKRCWVEGGGLLKVSVCAEYDSAAMVVRVGVQADSCAGAPGAVESVRVAAVLHDDATPPAQLSSKTQAAAATVLATHCVDVDTTSQASSCGVSEILMPRMGGTAGTSPVPLHLYDLGASCRNQERTLCQSDLLLYVRADPCQELLLVDLTLLQKPYKHCLQYHVDMSAVGRLQALTGLGQCVERSGKESTEIVPASLLRTILADADEHFGVKQQALLILREHGAKADAAVSLDTSWCDDIVSSSAAGGASDVVSRWTLSVSSFTLLCAGVASAVSRQSEADPGSHTLLEWLSVPWPQINAFTKYLTHFYRSPLRSLDGSVYALHAVLETVRSLTLTVLDGARCEGPNEAASGRKRRGAVKDAAATVVDLLRAVWCFFGATESGSDGDGDAADASDDAGLPNLVPHLRTEEERACAVAILAAVTECYHAVYTRFWDECGRGNRPRRIRLAAVDDYFCTTEGLLATADAGEHRRKLRRTNAGESDASGGGGSRRRSSGNRRPVRHVVLGRHPLDVVDACGARQPLLTRELFRFAFCAKSVAISLPSGFFSFALADAAADGNSTSDEVHLSGAEFSARFEHLLYSGDGTHAEAPRDVSVTKLIDAMRNEHVIYDQRDRCMRHSLPHARFSMVAALWGALPELPGAASCTPRPRTLPSCFLTSLFSNAAKPSMILDILKHKQGDERLFSELLRCYAASWSRQALRAPADAASQVVVARACTAADICAQVAQICAARAKETRAVSKSQKAGSSAAEAKFRMAPEARCKRLLGFFCASAEESPELPPTLGLQQRITSPMPADGGGQAPRTAATEQVDRPRQHQQGAALPSTLSLCVGKKAEWAQVARILGERVRLREALPFFHVRMGPKEAHAKRTDYLVRLHNAGAHDVFSALSREAADPTLPAVTETELAHHSGFCFWFLKKAVPSSAYSDARDTSPVAVSNAGIKGLLGTPSGHGAGGSEPTTAIGVGGVHWWLDGTASEVKPALVLSYSAEKTVHPCRPVGKVAWARGTPTPTANTVAVSRCKRLCLSAHSLAGRGAEVPPAYPVDMLPTTLATLLCKLAPAHRAFYTSCTTVKLPQQSSGSLVAVDLLASREASGPRVGVPSGVAEKLVASLSREATASLAPDDVAVLLRRSKAMEASLDSVCLVFGVHHGDQCGELGLPVGWAACVVGKLLAPVRCAADVDVGWSLTRRLVLCTLEGSNGGVSTEVCMELACNASADALQALLPAHNKAALGRGVVTLPPLLTVPPSAVASMKCPVGSLWASSEGVLNFVTGAGDPVRGTLVALPTAARHVSSSAWHPGAELPSLVTAATQHSDFVNVSLKLA
eukprot:Rhum_TRINITY_DN13310_c1_g1::Rhum_TRINITY_DN13310_c1_g1_i1::g.59120::m.59120